MPFNCLPDFASEASIPASKLQSYPYQNVLDASRASGTLWASKDKLYLWKTNASADSVGVFDIATKQWSSAPVAGDVDGLTGPGLAYVSGTDQDLSFALGPDQAGFVIFNTSNPKSLTWTNQTA